MQYVVRYPDGFSSDGKYPLIIKFEVGFAIIS